MQNRWRSWLTPPNFPGDELKTRQAALLDFTLLLLMMLDALIIVATVLTDRDPVVMGLDIGLLVICWGVRRWLRRGQVQGISEGLIGLSLVTVTFLIANLGTVRVPAILGYVLIIIMAGLLLDRRGVVVTMLVSSLSVAGLIWAEQAGLIRPVYDSVKSANWLSYTAAFIAAGGLGHWGLQSIRTALARAEREIAAHRVTEAALRESEAKYHELYEAESDAIVLVDRETHQILEVNSAATRIFGYSRAELLALKNIDLSIDPNGTRQSMTAQMTAVPFRQIRCKDGTLCPVEITASYITWHGRPCVLAALRNITERQAMEDALRASELLLRTLIDTLPERIFAKDLQSRFTLANASEIRLDGAASFEELRGKTDFDIYPHDLAQQYFDDEQPILTEGKALISREERNIDRAGQTRWQVTTKVPLRDAADRLIGLVGMAVDITERKQMEEALRNFNAALEQRVTERTAELMAANQRLTELDHLKDEFLSRTSHELRTPLAGILISLELLETAAPEKRDRYMRRLRQATDRLRDMLEDILMFAQLNAYTQPAVLESVDLNKLITSRLPMWQKLGVGRELIFQLDLTDVPRPRADSELLIHALTRLVTNAVSYTPVGTITLSTARRDEADQPWITIGVTDTGPGIEEDELPHIFERFYRGRAADDYKTPGTGIGLS
nr:PAS domain S-box protein [Thermoflexales bacterium]